MVFVHLVLWAGIRLLSPNNKQVQWALVHQFAKVLEKWFLCSPRMGVGVNGEMGVGGAVAVGVDGEVGGGVGVDGEADGEVGVALYCISFHTKRPI